MIIAKNQCWCCGEELLQLSLDIHPTCEACSEAAREAEAA